MVGSGNQYVATGVEAEHEPGSRKRVLRNLRGVQSIREMKRLESQALVTVTNRLLAEVAVDQRFTPADLQAWHRAWLGGLYEWAGEYRQVNLSKGGFVFAAAGQVPRLMVAFERGPLRRFTPCRPGQRGQVAEALGVVHAELILVHPFREGNGRLGRLLATLMALQAGLPTLDFGGVRGPARQAYFAAIQTAMDHDYAMINGVFERVIARTLRRNAVASSALRSSHSEP